MDGGRGRGRGRARRFYINIGFFYVVCPVRANIFARPISGKMNDLKYGKEVGSLRGILKDLS